MLPRENRLSKKKEIENVFKNGESFKENFLIIKVIKNNLKFSKFAFLVPKKVSKKAVGRNKIKRRLRELVRLKIKNIERGWDVVLLALPGLEKEDFWQMEKTINKIFTRARILKL